MKVEFPTEQLFCKVRPELKAGLDQLIEEKSRKEGYRSPAARFVSEALLLLFEKEGIQINGSRPVMKKPPRSAVPRVAVGS
jgi:hypothetical protein